MTNETEKLIEEAERYVEARVAAGDYRTPQELVEELVAALRRAEAERDAQHEQVLRLTAERDVSRGQAIACAASTAELLQEFEGLRVDLDEARAQVWGLICRGTNTAERGRYFQRLWEALLAENARLQQEHDAYCRKLANDGLTVASRLQRELDMVRSENKTLHYLRNGGR